MIDELVSTVSTSLKRMNLADEPNLNFVNDAYGENEEYQIGL